MSNKIGFITINSGKFHVHNKSRELGYVHVSHSAYAMVRCFVFRLIAGYDTVTEKNQKLGYKSSKGLPMMNKTITGKTDPPLL